jgi:hypothetical protein
LIALHQQNVTRIIKFCMYLWSDFAHIALFMPYNQVPTVPS